MNDESSKMPADQIKPMDQKTPEMMTQNQDNTETNPPEMAGNLKDNEMVAKKGSTASKKKTASFNILDIQNQKDSISKDKIINSLNQAAINNLSLELQRSIDFYQSQLAQPAPAKLFFDPIFNRNTAIMENIASQANLAAESLDLNKLVNLKTPIDLLYQMDSLAVIGGAMASMQMIPEKKNETAR